MTITVERVTGESDDLTEYLDADIVRNALNLWSLRFEPERLELYVCRDNDSVRAHLGIFRTPEADYVALGAAGGADVADLLKFLPERCVLTVDRDLYSTIEGRVRPNAVILNDLMVVGREVVTPENPRLVHQLSVGDAVEYARFGGSFNVPRLPIAWAEERLRKDIIFGMRVGTELVSVASLVSRLPRMAAVMGVETRVGFRGKGYGTAVTSAATGEGLKHSESCMLFVRSDNFGAIRIYKKLGYRKVGEELWVDFGTGLVP